MLIRDGLGINYSMIQHPTEEWADLELELESPPLIFRFYLSRENQEEIEKRGETKKEGMSGLHWREKKLWLVSTFNINHPYEKYENR